MDNYEPLERKIESTEPLYRQVADRTLETIREEFKKPHIKTGVSLGVVALTAILLTPDEAYAAQDAVQQTVENYGFFSGLLDGFLAPLNLIISAFSETTWARDGTGIASEPASFWYNLGYYLMIGGVSVSSSSIKKKYS